MKKMFFSAVFFKETPQRTDNHLSENQNKQLYKMLYFANNAIHESGGEPPLSLIWHWAKYGFCTPTKCRRLYTSESEFGGISKGRASRANCGKQNFKRGLTNGVQRCIMVMLDGVTVSHPSCLRRGSGKKACPRPTQSLVEILWQGCKR